jgi:hypothetical protein
LNDGWGVYSNSHKIFEGMISSNAYKQDQPQVSYQYAGRVTDDSDYLNYAFDMLFEEIMKQNNLLTTNDN